MNAILCHDYDGIARLLPSSIGKLAGKNVLITGFSGLIGSYLCGLLAHLNNIVPALERPCRILGIDSGIVKGGVFHIDTGIDTLLRGDVASVGEYLHRAPNFILHAASIASPKFYKRYPLETIHANVEGTRTMLELAKILAVESVVYFSSSEVYGDPDVIPTPESYVGRVPTLGPRSVYDVSKMMGETLCHVYHEQFNVQVKIVRPANIYGPGHSLEDGRIIPQIMRAAICNEPLKIYGDGTVMRSFCYLADAALQILWVMLEGENGEAYNVGDTQEVSMRELAQFAVGRFLISGLNFEASSSALQDAPNRRQLDIAKMLSLGCFRPSVNLENGLRRTYEWHKQQN